MSYKDLLETLNTWISIYRSITLSYETSSNISNEAREFHEKWLCGMAKVIARIALNDEIASAPVKKHMEKAIEEAKTGDIKKLDTINVLVGEVASYLNDRTKA